MATAPERTRTYGDQFEKTAYQPWSTWELSSLMTAATNPQAMPADTESRAALPAGDSPRPRRTGSIDSAATAPAAPNVAAPARIHIQAVARVVDPPDGSARNKKPPRPTAMPAAASQSRA